jgi:ABC-2 type transport system permease protein
MDFAKSAARHFRVLKAVASVTYKEWAAYRSHMMVSLFVGPVFLLAQIFVWKSLYQGKAMINGLSLDDMIRYFCVMALLNYIIMDFAGWNLQMLIHTGRFLTFALRPVHHPFFALSQKIGHRFLGLIFETTPVFLIIRFLLGVRLWPAYPGWALLSVALGFVMMFNINYAIGITGFWLTQTGAVRGAFSLLQMIFSGSFIPLVYFPVFCQKLLFYLPFQYTTYVPAAVILGKYQLGGMSAGIPQIVAIQTLAVCLMSVLTGLFYRLGVRQFTGVGA